MFKTICAKISPDRDLPERAHRVEILNRVLDGKLYDVLSYAFHEEKNDAGEYVLLRDRRPSVRTGIIKTVVDDSVSMLFSEGHFPEPYTENEDLRDVLAAFIKEAKLNWVMIEAATKGAVGSVAIWFRLLKSRVFIKALCTTYLTPVWKADAPDTLDKVIEKYKVKGRALKAAGYTGVEDEKFYWFERHWTEQQELWFLPREVRKADGEFNEAEPAVDGTRSVNHGLGFVPMVWVKNLPGGDDIDGAPTMTEDAINTVIECDYLLSQGGRGLKYSADPTLLIKEPSVDNDGRIVRSAGNAIQVDAEGDAKLLEINGTGATAILDYVQKLRDVAMESMHGNRSNPDKMSAAQSGRALELMHQALIWLADKLRISYGEGAVLDILKMVVATSKKYPVIIDGAEHRNLPDDKITLKWPDWFPPTHEDKVQQATALDLLIKGRVISEETATQAVAATYDIEDVLEERKKVEAQAQAAMDNEVKKTKALAPTNPGQMA